MEDSSGCVSGWLFVGLVSLGDTECWANSRLESQDAGVIPDWWGITCRSQSLPQSAQWLSFWPRIQCQHWRLSSCIWDICCWIVRPDTGRSIIRYQILSDTAVIILGTKFEKKLTNISKYQINCWYLQCSSDDRRSFGTRMTWIHREPCFYITSGSFFFIFFLSAFSAYGASR